MKNLTQQLGAGLAAGLLAVGLFAGPALSVNNAHADLPAGPLKTVPVASPADSTKAADALAKAFVDGTHLLDYAGEKPDVSNTTDALLALISADSKSEVVAKGTEWVKQNAADYLKTDGNPAGRAARLALLADATQSDPANFGGQNVAQILAENAPKLKDDPYSSALSVIALARLGVLTPEAVAPLVATQKADGDDAGALAYPPSQWGDGISADATALGLEALLAANQAEPAKAAQAWLTKKMKEDGSWEAYSPANTTGLAIAALQAAGVDTAKSEQWLAGKQLASGGYAASLDAKDFDAYATAQALLGLTGRGYSLIPSVKVAAAPAPAPSQTATPAATPEPSQAAATPAVASTPKGAKPDGLPATGSEGAAPMALFVILAAGGSVAAARMARRK